MGRRAPSAVVGAMFMARWGVGVRLTERESVVDGESRRRVVAGEMRVIGVRWLASERRRRVVV